MFNCVGIFHFSERFSPFTNTSFPSVMAVNTLTWPCWPSGTHRQPVACLSRMSLLEGSLGSWRVRDLRAGSDWIQVVTPVGFVLWTET